MIIIYLNGFDCDNNDDFGRQTHAVTVQFHKHIESLVHRSFVLKVWHFSLVINLYYALKCILKLFLGLIIIIG